jgi:hypothetical protein
VSVHQPLCYLLTPTQSSSDIMAPENTEEEPDDPELADE